MDGVYRGRWRGTQTRGAGVHNSLIREDDSAGKKINAGPGNVDMGGGNEGDAATTPWLTFCYRGKG